MVIAHRLQTIQSADRIYVLDHGRIEAAGRHEQLMSESSLYPRLRAQVTGISRDSTHRYDLPGSTRGWYQTVANDP